MSPSPEPSTRAPCCEIRPGAWIDARLALWLAAPRILVVADLHWGYAHSHRVQGNLLPAWGDAEIATRLDALLADYRPVEMIWLGDSLHTLAGRDAAEAFIRTRQTPLTVVSGNHDNRWNFNGVQTVVTRDGYFLHHGDQQPAIPSSLVEVIGHYHPAFSWHDGAGARLKLPAVVVSARRIVLPAFSPWAAGAPWKPRDSHETIYAIGTKRIFTAPPGARQISPFVS